MRYVVFTEVFSNHHIDRWYYGTYDSRECANDVAYELNKFCKDDCSYHCICPLDEAEDWEIKNLFN